MDFDIFIGYETACLESFKMSKSKGKVCVYDLAIVAYNFQKEICEKYGKEYNKEEIKIKKQEIHLADYILVGSEIIKRSVVELGINEGKIIKVPYGVDIQKFSPKKDYPKDKKLKVIYVGLITWRKGIEFLLKAASELKDKINLELNLVGPFQDSKEVLEKYRGLYNYYSYIPHEKLPQIYRQNDIFIFPSLMEGFAQVVIEAMACGLPVIVSDRTGSHEAVRNGIDGFILPAGDVNALKEKILYLIITGTK